jgi:hypothetical protein
MATPKRIRKWVLILTPVNGQMRDAITIGRMASRTAWTRKLTPIYPLLMCGGFMTEEELRRDYPREVMRWANRVERIWLCLPPSEWQLDSACHDVLLNNEGHMSVIGTRHHTDRCPVSRFYVQETKGIPVVSTLERSSIDSLLRCNITEGLFHGTVLAAAGG